jgi:hypothetical protein
MLANITVVTHNRCEMSGNYARMYPRLYARAWKQRSMVCWMRRPMPYARPGAMSATRQYPS